MSSVRDRPRKARRTGWALFAGVLPLVLIAVVALVPGASARPGRSVAVVPNGTYGALGAHGEYVIFKVRSRKVYDLAFNIQLTCQASDSPTSEQRFFSSVAGPDGRAVTSGGKWEANWREEGEGRYGQINAELKFGTRDVANFAVIVPERRTGGPEDAYESCDGVGSLRFNRGFELAPIHP